MKLNPKKTALFIIDIQVDFCSPKGLSAKRGRGMKMVKNILLKLKSFQERLKKLGVLTIFTQSITKNKDVPPNLDLLFKSSNLSPVCLEDTKGADIYYLTPATDDIIIQKQYYDAFTDPHLKDILMGKGIENILVTGVRTDICVDATAKRAFSEGFNVFIIEDLVGVADERINQHKVVLEIFKKYHGFVVNSEKAIKMLP